MADPEEGGREGEKESVSLPALGNVLVNNFCQILTWAIALHHVTYSLQLITKSTHSMLGYSNIESSPSAHFQARWIIIIIIMIMCTAVSG